MVTISTEKRKVQIPEFDEMKLFNSVRTGRIIKFEPERITRKKQAINRVIVFVTLLASVFGVPKMIDFTINNRELILFTIKTHIGG